MLFQGGQAQGGDVRGWSLCDILWNYFGDGLLLCYTIPDYGLPRIAG